MASYVTPLETRRARLRAFAYATLRTIELQCAWVASTPETALKIALGLKLGIDARRLDAITARLGQMWTGDLTPAAPPAYEAVLTAATALETTPERCAFLVAQGRELIAAMDAYCAGEKDLADQPSVMVLKNSIVELSDQLAALAPWAGRATAPVFPSLAAVIREAELRRYDGREALPPLVTLPAREPVLRQSNEIWVRPGIGLGFTKETLAIFLHRMFVDIEIAATEVCARMAVEYRDMPIAFKTDMCRQAWDECRHALVVLAEVERVGGHLGDYPYTGQVWTRYALGETLAERLAIQQLVQEGNSCDRAPVLGDEIRRSGFVEAADMLEQVNADEILHVQIGNRWLLYLCEGSPERYIEIIERAREKLRFPMGPIDPTLRALAGFPDWYMGTLREAWERQQAATRR